MKLIDKLRNFLYALTHADQLLAENKQLKDEQKIMEEVIEDFYNALDGYPSPFVEKYFTEKANAAGEEYQPVGRIEYYGSNGKISERVEYYDERSLLEAIMPPNDYYIPPIMSITIYRDPVTGKHIDASWVKELDPPLQDFHIEPYQQSSQQARIMQTSQYAEQPDTPPVGLIDYPGQMRIEFHNATDFIADIKKAARDHQPTVITVYCDPVTGRHLDTSWVNDLIPPPRGFYIEPYPLSPEQERIMEKNNRKYPGTAPVGRIDYLGFNGKVREQIEYHDTTDFIANIKQDNYCGIPMSITVYSDPATGKHIDTSWVKELDPPPQGFRIEPYQAPPEQAHTGPQAACPDYDYEP